MKITDRDTMYGIQIRENIAAQGSPFAIHDNYIPARVEYYTCDVISKKYDMLCIYLEGLDYVRIGNEFLKYDRESGRTLIAEIIKLDEI